MASVSLCPFVSGLHSSSSHWVLTGYKYVGPNPRTIQPTDWPYFGSIIKRYKPSDILPPLSTVWIPDIMRLNENVTPAGQSGGLMGSEWDPDRFVGDPSQSGYQVNGLSMGEQLPAELLARQNLLGKIEQPFEAARRGQNVQLFDKFQQQAFDFHGIDILAAHFQHVLVASEKPQVAIFLQQP